MGSGSMTRRSTEAMGGNLPDAERGARAAQCRAACATWADGGLRGFRPALGRRLPASGSSHGLDLSVCSQPVRHRLSGGFWRRLIDPEPGVGAASPQSNVRVVRSMFTGAINDGLHPGPNPLANLRLEQPRGRKDLIALTEPGLLRWPIALGAHRSFGPAFRAMILFAARWAATR